MYVHSLTIGACLSYRYRVALGEHGTRLAIGILDSHPLTKCGHDVPNVIGTYMLNPVTNKMMKDRILSSLIDFGAPVSLQHMEVGGGRILTPPMLQSTTAQPRQVGLELLPTNFSTVDTADRRCLVI